MRKILIANWKANPRTHAEAERLNTTVTNAAKKHKNVEIVLCMPFPWLTDISHKAKGPVRYGSQNMFWDEGPYTGEVSAGMLKNSKVEYAIIGHSERRRLLGETDEMVNKKVLAALRAGITPVLCIGETAEMHKEGMVATKRFIKNQLTKALRGVSSVNGHRSMVITYEPAWAISTVRGGSKNNADTPENALAMIRFMKSIPHSKFPILNSRFIYGGSVNGKNAKAFLQHREIEGALVGGASIRPAEFITMIKIASEL